MKSFDPKRLAGATVPLGVSWQLVTVMESKGRQDLYEKQSPEGLRTLREVAIVESTESSNRIEGVTVEHGRLRCPRRPGVVMARDCMEELGPDARGELRAALLDHAEAEVYVAEKRSLLGREEKRSAVELP